MQKINKWHKKTGITAVFFLILLSISGALLNHTTELDLQNRFVTNKMLLGWYNIHPKNDVKSFTARRHWITQINDRLYFDQSEITRSSGSLVGMVSNDKRFVVALDADLLVLTNNGEIIEKLSNIDGLPERLRAIGLSEQEAVIIDTANGKYNVDLDNIEWQQQDPESVHWSMPRELPKDLYEQILQLYRGKGLSLEKLILDIHSGRILGTTGKVLIDFMTILFLFLSISGIWMWYKYSQ